ncbi:DNA polymerase/3'-5' exonuclease PolX [Aridibaculum aurantiacum]|uniref:DNA polymerase/3'-5' exonuclease PolX n=1 Tax=Aridibaculum aurantiacum TaxID=2810307 RepID=UPI001A9680E8|nr:DNA polymerase/3'-5' exonuclease PolX [Aridibaculum aurantiacum]
MDNYALADNFSLLAKLIDIHGDDSFKAKSYSSAAFTLEKLPMQVAELPSAKLFAIKGIGQAIGKKIIEQLETGRLQSLDEYIIKTPPGIIEMLRIKGLGPKKICTVWKELGIENIGELLYACEENRLLLYKGFGAKTQQNIKDGITFYLASQGSFLFSQIEEFGKKFTEILQAEFPANTFLPTGAFNRHDLVVHKLEWVTDAAINELKEFFESKEYTVEIAGNLLQAKGPENVAIECIVTPKAELYTRLFENNCCSEFFEKWKNRFGWDETASYSSEEEVFSQHKLSFIPPYLRELPLFIDKAAQQSLPVVIEPGDVRGIIHSHSNWSDGVNTIEEMAKAAKKQGLEYLVISDHSQSAYYAGGLFPEKIIEQHKLVDELNKKLAPFKIFKSIESDILSDGSLDYPDEILASFDLVIASVHSNLKMPEEKAMARLLKAIANPYTRILGHMTGRLLLSRNGYPVDHKAIIDACAEHNVVIEINAHPRRLDMDYHFIPYALEKGVLLSIDPDAHSIDEYNHVRSGVLAAQKGGLTKEKNLSSFSLQEFESFLQMKMQNEK